MKRKFFATGIGSVPHKNAEGATELIFKIFPDIPFWPQLPKRSFFENMYAQFIEGFPGAVIDNVKNTLYIDTSKDFEKSLEEIYQKIIDVDVEYFSITKNHAEGFYAFLNRLKSSPPTGLTFVKGQITGPISFGLSVTDENKKAILYHAELNEVLTKILALKIRWQIRKIKEVVKDVIIFVDEPYLVSIGSSFVNIKRMNAVEKIKELVDTIHNEGALTGVHCCGNTDWSLLLASGIDILSFDAYNFMKPLSLYSEELKKFLDRDGLIAWGIVPTSKAIKNEQRGRLIKRFEEGMDLLMDKNISKDRLLDFSMITPSCGCGTLDIEEAEQVFDLTVELSTQLRKKYS